jgi:glutathione S-transferase
MVKVIGKASSINVRKVLWTCAEIGIPIGREDPDAGTMRSPAFLELNPNGMVPVLVDDGFVLWESNSICRYLCAAHGGAGLLPQAPRERARVEQWMDWQATELNNSWRYAFMALVRRSAAHHDPAQVEASVASWNRHVGILEGQLRSTGAYVAGDRFTLADIVLGLSLNRWLMTPMARPDYPAIAAYYELLSRRPAFLEHGRNGIP